MPPLVIAAGIGAAGMFGAGAMGARASGKAAETSADAADKAIDWEKDQYFGEQARLEPYRQLGGQAYARMGQMLGIGDGSVPQSAGTFGMQRTVRIRHPRTGEIRAVPMAQAERLKAKGGQVVG